LKFSVTVLPTAEEELKELPSKIQRQIKKKIDSLYKNALPAGAKILNTTEGYRRLRSGDYRVLYKVDGRKITVGKIGHRSHVYRWID
jgi:mRNA interferase RelE/StbE